METTDGILLNYTLNSLYGMAHRTFITVVVIACLSIRKEHMYRGVILVLI